MSDIRNECNELKQQLSDAFSKWGEVIESYLSAVNFVKTRFENATDILDSMETKCDVSIKAKCNQFVDKIALKMQRLYNYIDIDHESDLIENRFSRLLEEVDQFIQTLNKE